MNSNLNKRPVVCAVIAFSLAIASHSYGQLGGLGGLGKKKGDAASVGGVVVDKDAFGKSTGDVAGRVLGARIKFLDAKATLMTALGLKTESVTKASDALRAKEGSASKSGDIVDALKDSTKTTEDADRQFDAALSESKELSAEAKAKFAEGSGKFIEGVLLEKDQIEAIQALVQQGQSLVQSANPIEKPKAVGLVKPVTDLASIVPGDVKEGTTTLGKILKFAKSQKITNIPNTDKATAALGDL